MLGMNNFLNSMHISKLCSMDSVKYNYFGSSCLYWTMCSVVQWYPCKQQPSIEAVMIETTSSGISDQLWDIYSICKCSCNVATYKVAYECTIQIQPYLEHSQMRSTNLRYLDFCCFELWSKVTNHVLIMD